MNSKKDQIFKSALHLFTTLGFHGTPTSKIAKKAGVATGTLFHYFKTKDDLINELYLECKNSMIKSVLSGIREEDDFRVKMHRGFHNAVHWGVDNREEFLFFQQYSNSPNIKHATREEGLNRIKPITDFFEPVFKKGMQKGIEPEFLMRISFNIISGTVEYILKENITDYDKISSITDQGYFIFKNAMEI